MTRDANEPKVPIRLSGGPADGYVFTVPEGHAPAFIGFGFPIVRYEREEGAGQMISYRYVP
jgi:hypothetical protein